MPAPIFYGVNRLENAVLSAASTSTNRPLTRLADRFIGPRWEGTAPIVWDQGSTTAAFDTLLLAAGHNLGGATVTVETSAAVDFTGATVLGTGTIPSGTAAYRLPCTGAVARYSRLTVTGGPTTIVLAECWASVGVAAPRAPLYPTSPNALGNYVGQESEAGVWMAYIRGSTKWQADWDLLGFTRAVRDAFREFFEAIGGGGRAFWVLDDEGILRFARWINPETAFAGMKPEAYQARWQLREVLA